jgi:hypothetical protein
MRAANSYLRPVEMKSFLAIAGLMVFTVSTLSAQATASQSLLLEVKPVSKIAVSGNPGALVISDAIAGGDLVSVSDNSTTYSLLTNLENMKIVASISARMPEGTWLMIRLESSRGTSMGTVDLSNALTPVDVVTGVSKGTEQNQPVTYVFAANADVGQIPSDSRTITLTISE